jgi:hypothetical protein
MKGTKSANMFVQTFMNQFENPKPNSLLYNRFVLYFVFVLALFQLYTFSVSGNMGLAISFLLVGFLTSFFSKNMTVILVISLAFTGILQFGIDNRGMEGMTEGAETATPTPGVKVATEPTKDKVAEATKATVDEKDKTEKGNSKEHSLTDKKDEIAKDGKKLEALQTKILDNFQEISPYMKQAEGLVEKMKETASAIERTA